MLLHGFRSSLDDRVPGDNIINYDSTNFKLWQDYLPHKKIDCENCIICK